MGMIDNLFNKIDQRREKKRMVRQEELEHAQKVQAEMHAEQLRFEQEQWEEECKREEARREAEKREVERLLNLSEKEIWTEILIKLRRLDGCQTEIAKGINDLNLRVSYLEEQAEKTEEALDSLTSTCDSIESDCSEIRSFCDEKRYSDI